MRTPLFLAALWCSCAFDPAARKFDRTIDNLDSEQDGVWCGTCREEIYREAVERYVGTASSADLAYLERAIVERGKTGASHQDLGSARFSFHCLRAAVSKRGPPLAPESVAPFRRLAINPELSLEVRFRMLGILEVINAPELGRACVMLLDSEQGELGDEGVAALVRCVFSSAPEPVPVLRRKRASLPPGSRPRLRGLLEVALGATTKDLSCTPRVSEDSRCVYECPLGERVRDERCACVDRLSVGPRLSGDRELSCPLSEDPDDGRRPILKVAPEPTQSDWPSWTERTSQSSGTQISEG